MIEFLHALDAECPDVFLMLYWGYGSPWWLLHGDTLFDSGIGVEAANPERPAGPVRPRQRHPEARSGAVARGQRRDVPPLGKDSLGVWLSDWPWNGQIGKERWQERVGDGPLPRQPAGAAVDRHALAFAAGAEADGRVHRPVQGAARVFPQSRGSSSAIPWKRRALRLLLHGRQAGLPGV